MNREKSDRYPAAIAIPAHSGSGIAESAPALIAASGIAARFAYDEFFFGKLRNPHSRLVDVQNSIYDCVEVESEVERDFAKAMSKREDIKLFFKLPAWFKVETPIGTYNPDWAIVKQERGQPHKLYLVRETKSTKEQAKLRQSEWDKIKCGAAHFESLGVDFKHVTGAAEV